MSKATSDPSKDSDQFKRPANVARPSRSRPPSGTRQPRVEERELRSVEGNQVFEARTCGQRAGVSAKKEFRGTLFKHCYFSGGTKN